MYWIQWKIDKTVVTLYWGETIVINILYKEFEKLYKNKDEEISLWKYWTMRKTQIVRRQPYIESHKLESRIEHNFPSIKNELMDMILERSKLKWIASKINKEIVANMANSLLFEPEKAKEKKPLTQEQKENIKKFLLLKKKKLLS